MGKAGYCSQCSANVWVNEDGTCVAGHPADSVSNVYETGQPAPVVTAPPRPAGRKGLIILVIAVIAVPLLLLACGIVVAVAIPVFTASSDSARERQCFAQERMVEGAIQQYIATETDAQALPDWSAAIAATVPAYIKTEPVCPDGGTYTLSDGQQVDCSVHGRY